MKTAFTPGTFVRFNIPDGAVGRIGDVRKTWDWKIPGYLGDGFYEVIVEGRPLVAHEDDLVLYTPESTRLAHCNKCECEVFESLGDYPAICKCGHTHNTEVR